LRSQRRSLGFARRNQIALGLELLIGGLDHFAVFAQHGALGLDVRLGVQLDGHEEGSGERRREFRQRVG
jgi:hypothetical protein